MKLDFSVPISAYELLALIISGFALVIPLLKYLWNKCILRPKIRFLLAGNATLFFNQSGSYMQINGVIEAHNKAVTIRRITASIKRQKDDQTLNLSWSQFISPVNQSLVGNFVQTTEAAHPSRIEANSVICAFVQYSDPFDSFGKKFRSSSTGLFSMIPRLEIVESNYEDALKSYMTSPLYSDLKRLMQDEYFWEIDKYLLDITVEYNKQSKETFHYEFSVSEQAYQELICNSDESLIAPLKNAYNQKWNFHSAYVELTERKD